MQKIMIYSRFTLIFVVLAFSIKALSQDAGIITLGSVDVIPSLNVQLSHDDNIRSVDDDENPEADTIITIAPSVTAQVDNGVTGLSLEYGLTQGTYLSESDESYLDQSLRADLGWNVADAQRLTLSADLDDSHDARTPDALSGVNSDDLDEFRDTTWSLVYDYGDRSTFFAFSLEGSQFDRRYTTNRDVTSANDNESTSYGAGVDVNVSELLQFTLGITQQQVSYNIDETRDSSQQSYSAGVVWDVNEFFDLSASVGAINIKYDDASREDSVGKNTDLRLVWSPLSYSSISLSLAQDVNEPNNGSEDYIQSTATTIAWRHEWVDNLNTRLSYDDGERDYVGRVLERVDYSTTIGFEVDYQFRRWVSIGFGVAQESADGKTSESTEYDKTVSKLSASFTL